MYARNNYHTAVKAIKTILTIAVLAMILPLTSLTTGSQSIPCTVIGHVTVDGTATSGVHVSLSDGQSTTSGGGGYFQFTVDNGSSYTATASYNGHSGSSGFNAVGSQVNVNININTQSGGSPSENKNPTPAPTSKPPELKHGALKFEHSSMDIMDEGDIPVTVLRTGGSNGTVSVEYATADGTAIAGTNYQATSGVLTFNEGETSKSFIVKALKGDDAGKNITFKVSLSKTTGEATLGTPDSMSVTIAHGPINGVFVIDGYTYNITNAGTKLSISITRTEGARGNVTVDYYTVDETAVGGKNYVPMHGVLAFADGETHKVLELTILQANMSDETATFKVGIRNPTGGAFIGPASTARIIINKGNEVESVIVTLINEAGEAVSSGNPGEGGKNFQTLQQIMEKAIGPIEAIAVGVTLSVISVFWSQIQGLLSKLIAPIRELILGYFEEWLFHMNVRVRKVKAVSKSPVIFGISLGEIFNVLLSATLLGLAFSYAIEHMINLEVFLFVGLVAGLTIIVIQMASRLFANRYKMTSEYKFWDVGALTLILTSVFLYIPFARPAMVVLKEVEEHGEKHAGAPEGEHPEHEKPKKRGMDHHLMEAIMSISSPYTGLVLTIAFLLFILYGGFLGQIGIEGIKISTLLCSYGLLPFKPLEGKNIYTWNKLVWAMLFVPSILLFILVGVVLH